MRARRTSALLLAFLFIVCLAPLKAAASAKRRVAIMPFAYGAVSSEVGTIDVGKGITNLLMTKLVNDGTYSVIEREMLDNILKEQNLSVSDRADSSTACKIGKLLSVDAIIVGTVTQFGLESKTTNVGAAVSTASSFIPYGFGGFGGGIRSHKSRAQVAIDARVVDINTSEVLAAVHGAGESKRSGMTLFSGDSLDFSSSGFASSMAGEATLAAVDQIGGQIITCAAKIPDNQSVAQANVEGKVADVTGIQVIVNVGKQNGLTAGDNLQVQRPYKVVKDPTSGKVLKELSNTIAVITLNQVDPDSATGNIVKGTGVRVGDSVRKVTTDVSAILIQPVPGTESGTTTKPPIRTMSATGSVLDKKK
jgi:curli biogenesis system outer membrane secretion channel CsgG